MRLREYGFGERPLADEVRGRDPCRMTDTVRVQRVPDAWPVVHLESSLPAWDGLELGGQVVHARSFSLADLDALGAEEARDRLPLRVGMVATMRALGRRRRRPGARGRADATGQSRHRCTPRSGRLLRRACPVDVRRARVPGVGTRRRAASQPRKAVRCASCRRPSCGRYKGVKWAQRLGRGRPVRAWVLGVAHRRSRRHGSPTTWCDHERRAVAVARGDRGEAHGARSTATAATVQHFDDAGRLAQRTAGAARTGSS